MKIVKIKSLLIIAFVSISCFSNAQDLDEIILKHIKAHGKIEKWESVESMKISGRFTAFSIEEDFFAVKTKSGAYYSELYLGQHKVIESFNGITGWTIDPWQEIEYPRELNKTEINAFYQKAEFFTPFFKYKEKGSTAEYIGKENIEGTDVYIIKLTRKNGKEETWYLNAKTYLEYKCESGWVDFAYETMKETYFDDFRKANGLIIPHYVESTFGQRNRILQIEEVEFNIAVDESKFEMPRSEEIKKLAFLTGEWDVKVELMTRRGTWYNIDNTTSKIEFVSYNMLEEKMKYDRIFVQSIIAHYTYNSHSNNYRLAVYNDFSSNMEIAEGNFVDTAFRADNLNISFGYETDEMPHSRYSITEIKDDSFTVIVEQSRDKGETWRASDRFFYTRKK